MPITQQRMLALVLAAEDHREALYQIRRTMVKECSLAREGKKTAQEVMDYMEVFLENPYLMTDRVTSNATIEVELRHWKPRHLRENERRRIKQAEKRGRPARRQNDGLATADYRLLREMQSTAPAETPKNPLRIGDSTQKAVDKELAARKVAEDLEAEEVEASFDNLTEEPKNDAD